MQNHSLKRRRATIVQPWLEKSRVFRLPEIASRLCLTADAWETTLPNALRGRGLNKAFHSPEPGGVAIPDWPRNHGLYSIRAIVVLPRVFPATSLFSSATFAPVRRPNSLRASSLIPRLTGWRRKIVSTHPQNRCRKFTSLRLQSPQERLKNSDTRSEGDQKSLAGEDSGERQSFRIVSAQVLCFSRSHQRHPTNFLNKPSNSIPSKQANL